MMIRMTGTAGGSMTEASESASFEGTAPLTTAHGVHEVVTLEQILASAPRPQFGGIPDLGDEEADAFLDELGL